LPLQITSDYSEIGRLNEEEILMPAVTGVLFKWPLIRQIRGRGYGAGMEAMSDQTRAMYATEDALVARSRLVTTRFG
jgi:4-aminobutyrate aminotransferase-like enzyme